MVEILRRLDRQKESRLVAVHLTAGDVYMLISIPQKYAMASIVGYIKGKSAIHLAKVLLDNERTLLANAFGYDDTLLQPSVCINLLFENTSRAKSSKLVGWSN